MSLKDTFKHLKDLLVNITADLEKSENGNKAASQRVRTGTVRLEKVAKLFRKESISSEKKNKGQKKPTKSTAGKSKVAPASKAKAAPSKSTKSAAPAKAKSASATVKAKPKAARASVKARQLTVKRATAKLPTRRVGLR
jgi:Histone H1-like protein Hc1